VSNRAALRDRVSLLPRRGSPGVLVALSVPAWPQWPRGSQQGAQSAASHHQQLSGGSATAPPQRPQNSIRRSLPASRPPPSVDSRSPFEKFRSAVSHAGGITSVGRHGLIRRVAVPRRAQRECLPPALSCLVESIDPRQRGGPNVADAVRRGQRGDVHEQAGGAVIRRKWRQTKGSNVVTQWPASCFC
jgi:hypothetical protein